LAEALKEALGIEATLIESGGGVFEVRAGDALVFSKKQEKRFPDPAEIIQKLRRK
jgi:selT/selW/selH-like putative selenoprotein